MTWPAELRARAKKRAEARPGQRLWRAADERADGEVPKRQQREPGEHVEFAERPRQEACARDGDHPTPLEQAIYPRQGVAEPLSNPLADNVPRQEKLRARCERHGDERRDRSKGRTERDSAAAPSTGRGTPSVLSARNTTTKSSGPAVPA